MSIPIVAIVGRQNAGKSTLLNKVAGKRLAIVEDIPGTTRDRVAASVSWKGVSFHLVDTGGLESETETPVSSQVRQQIDAAIDQADVIILLVDTRSGITPPDEDIADDLRRAGKPLLLAANKADNDKLETHAYEFYQLGLGDPLPLSAHHGRGVADLLDKVVELLPEAEPEPSGGEGLKIAIAGRPNVGKSMLLNSILGEERSIVHDAPGTTRDAVDTVFKFKGEKLLLIDTAGIRRRGKVSAGIERYSVLRSLRAIDKADVVLLVIDAAEPLTAQDTHIAGYVQQASKGIIVVVNKWDLVPDHDMAAWDKYVKRELKFISYAPVVYTSAKFGEGVKLLLPRAQRIYTERMKRLTTSTVNDAIQEAMARHNLPRKGRRQFKVLYATQADVNPPTFVFFANDPSLAHFSYRRFLENRLRLAFGFEGTPLKMVFKARNES